MFFADQRIKIPALPNGIFVTDVSVTKISKGFEVTLTPSNCGHDFPLIGFRDTTTIHGSPEAESDQVIYSSGDFASGTNILVTRVQSASYPLGGMLQLEHDGKYTTGKIFVFQNLT